MSDGLAVDVLERGRQAQRENHRRGRRQRDAESERDRRPPIRCHRRDRMAASGYPRRALTEPRVSIIMPVRNGETYLREALDSMLAQTFADFELIVLDDGSTDATPRIVEEYSDRDPRVVLERRPARGLTSALNELVLLARGDVLVRMDHDDVALPDRIERQVAQLDADSGLAVVGGACIFVDSGGRETGIARYPVGDRAIRRALRRINCIVHSAAAMRADSVRRVGGYRFDQAEDYDLWLRLAERHRMANLSEPVIRYRRHPAQFSIDRLERQTLGGLVAQAAARRRASSGRTDGLAADTRIDRSLAHSLGISDRTIELAVEIDRLRLAAALAEAGDLESASRLAGEGAKSRTAVFRARERLRAGDRLGAAWLAGQAAVRHPILTLRVAWHR
jgi:glycosyltransferase involved in cell wall biosynthesis